MGDERPLPLDLLVKFAKSAPISVHCESGDPPHDFSQQINRRGDVEDLDAESGCAKIDDLESRRFGSPHLVLGTPVPASRGLRSQEELDQFESTRRTYVLGEVGATGCEYASDLISPDRCGMPTCHKVESVVGERKWWLIGTADHHNPARMQQVCRARDIGWPRLRRYRRRREAPRLRQHFATAGLKIQRCRRGGETVRHRTRVTPRRAFLGCTPVQPREIPTRHVGGSALGHEIVERGGTAPSSGSDPDPTARRAGVGARGRNSSGGTSRRCQRTREPADHRRRRRSDR